MKNFKLYNYCSLFFKKVAINNKLFKFIEKLNTKYDTVKTILLNDLSMFEKFEIQIKDNLDIYKSYLKSKNLDKILEMSTFGTCKQFDYFFAKNLKEHFKITDYKNFLVTFLKNKDLIENTIDLDLDSITRYEELPIYLKSKLSQNDTEILNLLKIDKNFVTDNIFTENLLNILENLDINKDESDWITQRFTKINSIPGISVKGKFISLELLEHYINQQKVLTKKLNQYTDDEILKIFNIK